MWLAKTIPFLVELAAAGGLIFTILFVSWTKIALGAILAIAGAFFPRSASDKAKRKGQVKIAGATISLQGFLRVVVMVVGLVLIVTESINSKIKSDKYTAASDKAATLISNYKDPTFGQDDEKSNMSLDDRIEKLTEIRDSLKTMQTLKPDPRVESALASVEATRQGYIVVAQMRNNSVAKQPSSK